MNLSMRWLKDYCDISICPKEYASRMTMSGSKVEGYEIEGDNITNTVIGKIISINPHPHADKLVVCCVDIGSEKKIQIVTGAPNVFVGAVIPVALNGASLPGGIEIKSGELRGELSEGMMCSVTELGLSDHDFPPNNSKGIMILDDSYKIGENITDALHLNDTCVEFEITSNRPDCLSVRGLARETHATFGCPLNLPIPHITKQSGNIEDYLSVRVENSTLCTRYNAKVVANVKIEDSPMWMRERLRASGVRPINNLVDITNFVMLEYGHPMHAFDHKYVHDKSIIVRNAKSGEHIVTLEGVDHSLSEDMLVICDPMGPLAVAGVMGGEFSGIMDDTQTVVFEAACFNGANIRRTSRDLGLRTDSSSRFEKGLDSNVAHDALIRACQLVEELGAGDVVDGEIDVYKELPSPVSIEMDWNWVNEFLGTDISPEMCRKYLGTLDFKVDGNIVTSPTYRIDIHHKTDIAEEIARLFGYDKIPTTTIRGTSNGGFTSQQLFRKNVENTLLGFGLNEIITYSFISPKYYDKIFLDDDKRESVVISNPLGEDTSIMRVSAIPSMLETVSKNIAARNLSGKFYEIATEYIPTKKGLLPDENQQIMMAIYGDNTDFYELKGYLDGLLSSMNCNNCRYIPCKNNPSFHPGITAEIVFSDGTAGIIGEIHPSVLKNYKIGTKVFLARISLSSLEKNLKKEKLYSPLPKFPSSTRDLALVCDSQVLSSDILDIIRANGGENLVKVSLFDVYTGGQLPNGKKSLAYNLIFRNNDKTLNDKDCDDAVNNILNALSQKNISIRV